MTKMLRLWPALYPFLVVCGLLCSSLPAAEPTEADEAEKSAEQLRFERVIAKVEPGLVGSVDRLPLYIDLFRREMVNDTRLFPFHAEAQARPDGRIVLEGHVGFAESRSALAKLFRYLGFDDVENHVEVLPSTKLGEMRFGFVRTTHAFSREAPGDEAEVVTDCLLGTPLFLLKQAGNDSFLCHSVEGYVGYVSGKNIHRVGGGVFYDYQAGKCVQIQRDHDCPDGLQLPAGARLRYLRTEGGAVIAALPDGDEVKIPRKSCRMLDDEPQPKIERIVAAASHLLGTKYVWGGNTSEGIDCSGLVQTAFATEGITLARDASQQILAGALVATRRDRDGLRPGDTLYFLGSYGKVRHTALYVGNGRYIEAVRPVVRYSSFNSSDKDYSPRGDASFCYGKRILQ